MLKVAVFDFDDVEDGSSQALTAAVPRVQTVVSGMHWTDMMSPQASKGRALAALQARFGILPEQTAVFGDYLNDLDLYDHADLGSPCAMPTPASRRRPPIRRRPTPRTACCARSRSCSGAHGIGTETVTVSNPRVRDRHRGASAR